MDLLLRAPECLVRELDARVDKDRFMNRTHLMLVVLADWLAREIHTLGPYSAAERALEREDAWVNQERVATKRALLGEEWDKYKSVGGDMLDGQWDSRRLRAQTEAENEAYERRARLKSELRDEIRDELKETLLKELREEIKDSAVLSAKGAPKGKARK